MLMISSLVLLLSLHGEFSKLMGSEFEISTMGELSFFLVLPIKQTPKGTSISQEKYIKESLKKFQMENAKPMTLLWEQINVDEPVPSVNETMYRVS